jgi:hypothetical protein
MISIRLMQVNTIVLAISKLETRQNDAEFAQTSVSILALRKTYETLKYY